MSNVQYELNADVHLCVSVNAKRDKEVLSHSVKSAEF